MTPRAARVRALFHLDSAARTAAAKTLRGLANLLEDPRLKGRVDAALVANGPGWRVCARKGPHAASAAELAAQGVEFLVCANTLKGLGIGRRALAPFVRVVPSAMGEIALRGARGWTCVHPSP